MPLPGLDTQTARWEAGERLGVDTQRWPSEGIALEIEAALDGLASSVRGGPAALPPDALDFLALGFRGTPLGRADREATQTAAGLRLIDKTPQAEKRISRDGFPEELRRFLADYESIRSASFRVTRMDSPPLPDGPVQATILYELAGAGKDEGPIQDLGVWETHWREDSGRWVLHDLRVVEASRRRASGWLFEDVTQARLARFSPSFHTQLSHGTDHWASRLDAATGIDFYRMDGIAVGDFDGDGWEDFYVCQPGGLPNRLFRNRGDGTFEDVTEQSGLGILDPTAAAVWADYNNNGHLDLFVIGPEIWLFENDGRGRFTRSEKARFEIPAQESGSLMSAALADYDRDGYLDLYVCQYSPAGGSVMANSLHLPTPYHDANNGPPNQLFRNNGDGTFSNVTARAGLTVHNQRWSFAAAWSDYTGNGYPDLYVANDFGQNNLYRNNGDGTFTDVTGEAGVEDFAAGMSAAWEDYDNDGHPDLYVSNIWSAAGQRLMAQEGFQQRAPEEVRALFRRFAKGNTLYRNRGDGTFEETTFRARVENGGWAWGSDFFDFDNDGWEDLLVVNGYITNDHPADLEGFHWQQITARSPLEPVRSKDYDEAWRDFQDLMREFGFSTHGGERNRLFLNRGDGTFAEVSGLSGLDLQDDGRTFAITDFDNDGALDVILKNRTGPQVRLLRNSTPSHYSSISFALEGTRSNRDAVGTKVTLTFGERSRTKELKSGSGFLSQHTRRLHFGVGEIERVDARIVWPSGLVQELLGLPAGHIVRLREGDESPKLVPFRTREPGGKASAPAPPAAVFADSPGGHEGTWLAERVRMPQLALRDVREQVRIRETDKTGLPVLLNFWAQSCEPCGAEKEEWRGLLSEGQGFQLWRVEVDPEGGAAQTRPGGEPVPHHTYRAASEDLRALNVLMKHLFVRRRDMAIPLTLLLDAEGYIVKLYRGGIRAETVLKDLGGLPQNDSERIRLAVPFSGLYHRQRPDRQEQYFGIAYDYLKAELFDEALEYFQAVLRLNPRLSVALNNVGTIQLRKGLLEEAHASFRRALELEPGLVELRFNLGTVLAVQGRLEEATRWLEEAARMDSRDAEIWNNLGNVYLNMGRFDRARGPLERALELEPELAEAHNNLGIILGEAGRLDLALQHFQQAVRARPDFAQGYLNIGIVFLNTGQQERGIEMLRKVLELDPMNREARQMLDRLGVR